MNNKLPLFILLFFISLSCRAQSDNDNQAGYFSVTKVVDGDTFWVDDGSEKGMKIRLIGIDTPESRNSGRKKIGYFGKEAKAFMVELLKDQKVRLEYDVGKTDRYKRTLAYVYLEDGTFINAKLVKEGFATVMTIPPNVKYAELFVALEQEARENNKGLWDESKYPDD